MRDKEIKEGLADLAHKVEQDHEVQLARGELYKAAKYSIKLHELLKNVSEQEGLDGWVSAKITKASDYLSTVYHHLDYQTKFETETFEGQIKNPAPDMNKYGIHSTKMKGEPYKAYRHNKLVGEFDTIEELTKFLTDLVNKESSYKNDLHNKLQERSKTEKNVKETKPKNWKQAKSDGMNQMSSTGSSKLGVTVGKVKA